jgi:hypothetical protein
MKTIIGGNFFKTAKSAVQSINHAFDNKDKSYSEYIKDINTIKSDFEKCCRENDFKDVPNCLGRAAVPLAKENLCRAYKTARRRELSTEKTKGVHGHMRWSKQMDESQEAKKKDALWREMRMRGDLDKITEGGNKIKKNKKLIAI